MCGSLRRRGAIAFGDEPWCHCDSVCALCPRVVQADAMENWTTLSGNVNDVVDAVFRESENDIIAKLVNQFTASNFSKVAFTTSRVIDDIIGRLTTRVTGNRAFFINLAALSNQPFRTPRENEVLARPLPRYPRLFEGIRQVLEHVILGRERMSMFEDDAARELLESLSTPRACIQAELAPLSTLGQQCYNVLHDDRVRIPWAT